MKKSKDKLNEEILNMPLLEAIKTLLARYNAIYGASVALVNVPETPRELEKQTSLASRSELGNASIPAR